MCNSTGELGHSSAALTAVQQALLLDPMNADLIAQAKELHIIEKEKLEEKKMMMMMMMMKDSKKIDNDAKYNDDKDDVKGVKVGRDNNEDQLIIKDRRRISDDNCIIGSGENSNLADELNKCLISLDNYNNTTTANNNNNINDDVKGDDHSINTQLVRMKMNIITGIEKDNALRTTFRLSGCIQQLIKTIHRYTDIYKQIVDDVDDDDNSNNSSSSNGSSNSSDDGNSKRKNVKMILSSCYDILAILIDQQRASKLLIIELKLITSIKSLIKFIHINRDISLLKSLIHLCYVLCYDDICMKSMNIIIGDKIILCYLSSCIGNISYNLNTLQSNTTTTITTTTSSSIESDHRNNNNNNDNNNFKDKIECLEISIKIFKIALFSTISQNIFNTLESSVSCTIAYSITTMFQCALSYYNKITKDDYLVIYESVS